MVNPALTAVMTAAASEGAGQEAIEARLKKAGAISADSAVSLSLDKNGEHRLAMSLAAGTVRQTSGGRYYVNELALANRAEGQGWMALLILLMAASAIASIIALVAGAR